MERLSRLGPLIGKGASANVYRHPQQNDRVVKLLVRRPHFFDREKEALSMLPDFPGVCQCLGTITCQMEGVDYPGFVFPLYEQPDPSACYLNPISALERVAAVCRSLIAVHQCGIVHRDVKPGSLMTLPDGTVVLIDYGSAGRIGDTKPFVGTPGYMATELLLGEPVDQRTDIFSLGVVLYELIFEENPLLPQLRDCAEEEIMANMRYFWGELASFEEPLPLLIKTMTAYNKKDRFLGAAETYMAILRTLYSLKGKTIRF